MPSKLNLPNAIGVLRVLASPVLVLLALRDESTAVAWLFAGMFASDWIDGKIAILLNQRTEFGARLDSVADFTMYTALLFAACWLKWDVLRSEALWLAAAVAGYVSSSLAGFLKYRRLPSYHTRAAKTWWLLNGIAAFSVFADGPIWPLHVSIAFGLLTNFESILITWVLPRWKTNVTSVYHAIRDRDE